MLEKIIIFYFICLVSFDFVISFFKIGSKLLLCLIFEFDRGVIGYVRNYLCYRVF